MQNSKVKLEQSKTSCAFAAISHEGKLLDLSMLTLLIIESLKRKCPKVSNSRGIVYALQDNWQITSKHRIGILADCGQLQNMDRDFGLSIPKKSL